MVLEKIQKENDIKELKPEELKTLADEIRQFLIEHVSETGGHLASNLGVVELTIALHLALDLPKDKLIWDVGHQAYTHKLLTGRRYGFETLRQYGGMSGFPKRKESSCDAVSYTHLDVYKRQQRRFFLILPAHYKINKYPGSVFTSYICC